MEAQVSWETRGVENTGSGEETLGVENTGSGLGSGGKHGDSVERKTWGQSEKILLF